MGGASEAPVPETIEGLRRQNSAYRALCASMEAIQADQTAKGRAYQEAIATLDSEREANRLLTEEVEAFRNVMEGIDHFSDAVAYRDDTLSVALRQWISAGRSLLTAREALPNPLDEGEGK